MSNINSVSSFMQQLSKYPFEAAMYMSSDSNEYVLRLGYRHGNQVEVFKHLVKPEVLSRPTMAASETVSKFVQYANDTIWLWKQFGVVP